MMGIRVNGSRIRLAGLLASSSAAALLIGGGTPAFAACYTGPYAGGYINSGAASCIVVNNTSFTGNLGNTGTISAGSITNGTGIAVINNSTITGQITDSGVISVTGPGILIDSTSKVVSGGTGIRISGPTFSGGISNAGTISVSGNGIFVGNTVVTAPIFSGGISNSGTISGGGGINIDSLSTFSGGIGNTGKISASNGTAINIFAVSTFTGGISNSSTITGSGNTAINIFAISTFTGGISNSGTISTSGFSGIRILGIDIFSGGISNSATITSGGIGIQASAITFIGGISNSGTITSGGTGAGIAAGAYIFTGGISNSGTISGGEAGITANATTFTGGINNSGLITANGTGFNGGTGIIASGTTFSGGISNSGTISASNATGSGVGISVNVLTFSGGISNSGTILPGSADGIGIRVSSSSFSGGISNSGTISVAGRGVGIDGSASIFTGGISNSGTITSGGGGIYGGGSIFSGGINNSGKISAGTGAGIASNATTFNGGISNSGTISGGYAGISAYAYSVFSGGVSNSGLITANGSSFNAGTGINAGGATFLGGITNSGTISAGGIGIRAYSSTQFGGSSASGGIANSGTISAGNTGIYVTYVSTFSGGITNTGTISSPVGILVTSSGAISIFDSGTIIGSSGTAVNLSGNAAGNIFTLGPGYNITGLVKGQGSDTFQLGGSGSGSFNLSNIGTQYTGFGTFNVVSGVWSVSGATTTDWTVAGGTLGGTATIGSVTVGSGGTFAPGTAGTAMTVNSLTLQSASVYMVTLNGTKTSSANVSGAASIVSGARFAIASGSAPIANTTYTVLAATGGVTGTFANPDIFFGAYEGVLSYAGSDVDLTVKYASLLPLLPAHAPANVINVANTIDTAVQNGVTLPAGFTNLFNLAPAQLQYGLSQLSGEAATAAGKGTTQLMNDFMELMLDPTAGGGGRVGSGANGFAPEQDASLPSDVALAYAMALKAPATASFDDRWSAWGSAFGGTSSINGNAAAGTNNVTASDYGFAAGMERHLTPDTVYGFGLAGGGTNWTLAQALGSGRSDSFQAGAYAKTHWGPLYLSGALAFANHWFTTDRTALGDQLQAKFTGQSYAARGEVGYRYALPITGTMIGITPYAALQVQDFHTPGYSETDLTGGGFVLSYASANATDTRSELGARFDNLQIVNGMPLVLRGRLAWAHDWYTNATALNAAFQALPGSTFTVNGAVQPKDSAHTTAVAELHITPSWTAIAKFDGEFGSGARTYGGTGTLKYSW